MGKAEPVAITNYINVRDLLEFKPKELLDGLRTNLNVKFEDGVIDTIPYKEIILLRYLMDVFTLYPEIQITSKYKVSNYYSSNMYTSDTLNKWMEIANLDIINYVVKPNNDRSLLVKGHAMLWEIVNNIYNELLVTSTCEASSLSIEDLLEIQMDTNLLNAMKDVSVKKTVESVTNAYNVLEDVIFNKESIRDNFIVRGYISNSINRNQTKQLLGPRGFVTEINNQIYKIPIPYSFVLGLGRIYDVAIESRSGAKALNMSHKAIQESEYFARELQLSTMVVEKVVDGDCGTKNYMDWYVFPGDGVRKPDIDNLIGLRFINPETNKEEVLGKHHTELVNGKTIKLRTALSCKLKNPREICTCCMGEISYSIPTNSNIGHYCSTALTRIISQNILSIKHLMMSASSSVILLDAVSSKFFTIKNNNIYYFKNIFNSKYKYKLIIDQKSGYGIKELAPHVNVSKFDPVRVAMLEHLFIEETDNKGNVELYPITILQGNRYGTFTHDFLEYIVKERFTMDDFDRHVIDLSNWDYKKPFIVMPEIEYDFLTLVTMLRKKLKFMVTDKLGVSSITPEYLLQDLYSTINFKLGFSLAMLSVIVYAFTVKDPSSGDYSLGRTDGDMKVAKMSAIMKNRSLGGLYAWEEVNNCILSPSSFKERSFDHPLDIFFSTEKVLKSRKLL